MLIGFLQRVVRWAVLPLSRAGLPVGVVLRRFGLAYLVHPAPWPGPTDVVVRRHDGQRMQLDLTEWTDRIAYFTGRYYEKHTEEVMTRLLRTGDAAVDIGGNNGLLMLHVAGLVGSKGRVDVFEPNPRMVERIQQQIDLNQLNQVTLHSLALGTEPGEATLSVPVGFPGTGSLAAVSGSPGPIDTFTVRVATADVTLASRPQAIRLVKIDVEGFEVMVLRGMEHLLAADRPFVICECLPELLERAGSSREEFFADMARRDYIAYGLETVRHRLKTALRVRENATGVADYVWVPAERRAEFAALLGDALA